MLHCMSVYQIYRGYTEEVNFQLMAEMQEISRVNVVLMDFQLIHSSQKF